MLDLFDQAYFLKITPLVQKERILKASDRNRQMDINEKGMMIWGNGWSRRHENAISLL
jgi:hypothetical protein